MEMKKLYALLVILIVIYVGINVIPFGFDSQPAQENVTTENMVSVGASVFSPIENFNENPVNDTAIDLVDDSKGVTVTVSEIDNSESINDIFTSFAVESGATSNQTIDQNGVTTYLVYNEGESSYGVDIFFNKNGQNYHLSGSDISYDNSDYFINTCKNIIDTIDINSIT